MNFLGMVLTVALSLPMINGTDRCPPYVGTFRVTDDVLTVTIVRQKDQIIEPRVERVANPPADAHAWEKRGNVEFNAHVDDGKLFIHWETVKEAKTP